MAMFRVHRKWGILAILVGISLGCSSKPNSEVIADQPVVITETATTGRLLEVLLDERVEGKTRADAAWYLGRREAQEAVGPLLKLLPGDENAVTNDIIVALGDIGDPRILPILENLSYESGKLEATRRAVVEQLQLRMSVSIKESDATAHLLEVLDDRRFSRKMRADAAALLGNRKAKEAVDTLLRLLPGDENALTCAIMIALGEIGDQKALPILEKLSYEAEKLEAARASAIKLLRKQVKK